MENKVKTKYFYHGTTENKWKLIQDEGILWGRRYIVDEKGNPIKEIDRCTYLATDILEAEYYGDVLLQVEFNPCEYKHHNYENESWQVRIYEPIPLEKVKRIK